MLDLRDFVPFNNYISKNDMETGGLYFCKARNFNIAIWDGEKFIYTRQKFGSTFEDYEYHWDDGAPFGTVKPLVKIEGPLYGIR